MSDLSTLLDELKKAADSVKTDIQTLDEQIHALNGERESLMNSPVSREDFAAYVRADLAKRGELFQYRIKQFADHTGRGNAKLNSSFVALDRVFQGGRLQNFPFMNGEDCFDGFAPSADAFFFYFGDLIAERFMAALDVVHDWPQGAIPVADLRKRIAEIDHELDALRNREIMALADKMIREKSRWKVYIDLARQYGTSTRTIQGILNGKGGKRA